MLKRWLLALFLALPAFSQPAAQGDLDDYILRAMKTFDVPGVGVAVVKDGAGSSQKATAFGSSAKLRQWIRTRYSGSAQTPRLSPLPRLEFW
jgi:hypothetical protein